jgi:hypothetical protein
MGCEVTLFVVWVGGVGVGCDFLNWFVVCEEGEECVI